MNEIVLDPSALYQLMITVCISITTISAALAVVAKAVQMIHRPEEAQNDRITILEQKVADFEALLDTDNRRLKSLEEGNRVTQQSILALLSHALNGNDVDSLRDAKTNLENYLIGKEEK